jgi:hypothetical protein
VKEVKVIMIVVINMDRYYNVAFRLKSVSIHKAQYFRKNMGRGDVRTAFRRVEIVVLL